MKQQGRLIAATLFAAAIMSTLPGYLVMPVSDSVRPALLIKLPWMAPKKGDYVTFELHNKKLPNGHAFLTKRIGCTSGDNLENRAGAFFAMAITWSQHWIKMAMVTHCHSIELTVLSQITKRLLSAITPAAMTADTGV